MKPFLLIQGSDFAPHAIDIAVRELVAVATPGEGFTSNLIKYLSFNSAAFHSLSIFSGDC